MLVAVSSGLLLCFSSHGHKGNRCDLRLLDASILAFFDKYQRLGVFSNRDHETAVGSELVDQRLRDLLRRCRDDDHIERGMFEPALVAITTADLNICVA